MLISKGRTTVVVHTTWDDVSDTTSGCHGSRTQRCKAVSRGSPDPECRDDPWRHRRGRDHRGARGRTLGATHPVSRLCVSGDDCRTGSRRDVGGSRLGNHDHYDGGTVHDHRRSRRHNDHHDDHHGGPGGRSGGADRALRLGAKCGRRFAPGGAGGDGRRLVRTGHPRGTPCRERGPGTLG